MGGLFGGGVSGDCPAAAAPRVGPAENVFDLLEGEYLREMLLEWTPSELRS
jgi:hypothetical protein